MKSPSEAKDARLGVSAPVLDRRTFLKWLLGMSGAVISGNALTGCQHSRVSTLATATPTIAPQRAETATMAPTATPTVTATPTATATPTPSPTPEPTSTPTETPSPTPTDLPWVLPTKPSKLGLHTVKPNNAFPFVREVTEAGGLVRLVKGVGNFGVLREIKSVSPRTVTIGRWPYVETVETAGDPEQTAAWVMQQHMEAWQHDRDAVDYWEVLNEVNPGNPENHQWLARFYWAAMDIAESQGYRLALFSYPAGAPEWQEWAAIVRTGIFARAKRGGHILALHEYDWPFLRFNWGGSLPGQPAYDPERGVFAGRYRHLYRDFLIPRGEVIPLAITECGFDPGIVGAAPGFAWKRQWLRELAWYDSKLVEDDYVIGAAIFTLGGGADFAIFDYEALLPDLRKYILQLKDL